jgi:hypothetical protein
MWYGREIRKVPIEKRRITGTPEGKSPLKALPVFA